MAETKDAGQKAPLIPFPLLAAAYLLFFCLECVLAVEVRAAAFFSDSIVFLEGASVSVLMSPGLKWSIPGRKAFARFARTMIFSSDVLHVLDDRGKLLQWRDSVRIADGDNRSLASADQYRVPAHVEPRHVHKPGGVRPER